MSESVPPKPQPAFDNSEPARVAAQDQLNELMGAIYRWAKRAEDPDDRNATRLLHDLIVYAVDTKGIKLLVEKGYQWLESEGWRRDQEDSFNAEGM